jgi:hypothetical protein
LEVKGPSNRKLSVAWYTAEEWNGQSVFTVLHLGRTAWSSPTPSLYSKVTSDPHLLQRVRGNADRGATWQLGSGLFKGIFGWVFLVIHTNALLTAHKTQCLFITKTKQINVSRDNRCLSWQSC